MSRIESSSPIATIFELAQGLTHPVHIDKCSEAQFKFGVHLGCKKMWPPALLIIYQSALETNNRPMRTFYYWGRGDGKGGGGGVRRVGLLNEEGGKTKQKK